MAKEKLLTQRQREQIALKFIDTGNLALASWLFGQFLADKPFDLLLAVLAVLLVILAYLRASAFMKGGDD